MNEELEQILEKLDKILHAQTLMLAMMMKPDGITTSFANINTVKPDVTKFDKLAGVILDCL